jgi:hypothetical protein
MRSLRMRDYSLVLFEPLSRRQRQARHRVIALTVVAFALLASGAFGLGAARLDGPPQPASYFPS